MDHHIIMTAMGAIISTMIAVVVIIMIGMIDAHSHHRKSKKVGRIVPIIVRRIIWDISRGIHILNYRS